MKLLEKAATLLTGERAEPAGTIHVVDRSPLNWLYITYNTVEELVRVAPSGAVEPAAMESYRWVSNTLFEVTLRAENRFPDGERLTAQTVKRSFDEMMKWRAPHPPGTFFNLDPLTKLEVVDDLTVRFHLPRPDSLLLGKLRAMHLMNTRFWETISFGYARQASGEGHW